MWLLWTRSRQWILSIRSSVWQRASRAEGCAKDITWSSASAALYLFASNESDRFGYEKWRGEKNTLKPRSRAPAPKSSTGGRLRRSLELALGRLKLLQLRVRTKLHQLMRLDEIVDRHILHVRDIVEVGWCFCNVADLANSNFQPNNFPITSNLSLMKASRWQRPRKQTFCCSRICSVPPSCAFKPLTDAPTERAVFLVQCASNTLGRTQKMNVHIDPTVVWFKRGR